jgi:hypothetical protein
MGKIAGWIVGMVLVFGYFSIEGAVDRAMVERERPPAATPDKAPYRVDVYQPSSVVTSYQDEGEDGGEWAYHWELSTASTPKQVVDYYRTVWPDAMQQDEEGTVFEFVPTRAGPDEKTRILITEGQDIRIEQQVRKSGWLPSDSTRRWMIRLGFFGLIFGIFMLGRGRLAEFLARTMMAKQMAEGGTRFEKLATIPSDPVVAGFFNDGTRNLQMAGFEYAFDFTSPTVKQKNFERLLHRNRQTFAVLYHAVINNAPYTYVDLMTRFKDGSSVSTTTSRFVNDMKRPPQYVLNIQKEGTPISQALAAHDAAVAKHGAEVDSLEPDQIFDVWREAESSVPMSQVATPRSQPAPTPLLPPPAAPSPQPHAAPAMTAAPTIAAVKPADAKKAFKDEVVALIQQTYPDWQITERADLEIYVQSDRMRQVVDIEPLFYLCQKPNMDRAAAITSFVQRIPTQAAL